MSTCHNKLFLNAPLLVLLALLSASAQQTSTNTQQRIASEPARLVLNVTVMNGGGEFVTGLKQENFAALVDKVPSRIVHFSDKEVPISVGIVFDASGSMNNPHYSGKSGILQEAIARFFELSNKSNEYFVIGFNYRPELLLDWTVDTRTIVDMFAALQPKGNTAFYDTCYLGVEKAMHGRYNKRAIILISDGQDNDSHYYSVKELRDLVRESNVLVYSINLLGSDYAGSALGGEGQEILNELSWTSGGRVFYRRERARVKATEVIAVFEMIAQELRHQYSIAILPGGHVSEQKWRKIKINLTPTTNALREMKHFSVRTREGYYSLN
jgi:Ca-activated chloride channel homolog